MSKSTQQERWVGAQRLNRSYICTDNLTYRRGAILRALRMRLCTDGRIKLPPTSTSLRFP